MKKSSVALMAAALILSSCGTLTQLASSSQEQKFQDGIYASTPDLISKEEKAEGKAETEELIAKTKESPIYLFGDKKDTIMLPESHSATIRYDKSLSSMVVTVMENPYDWRNNLNPWSYYTPYSIGSSWYWSRHWSPFWSMSPYTYSYMYGSPWFYGWGDPWYYGGYWGRWYDPFDYWGFWGWNSPWYYTGYWGYPWYPHYAGWYGGFYPHWSNPHYGHGGPGLGHGGHFSSKTWYGPRHETQNDSRVFTDSGRTTVRRGVGSSSSTGRGTLGGSSASRSSVTASKSSGGNSAVRRTVTRQNAAAASGNTSSKPSASSESNVSYRRPAVSSGSQNSEYVRGNSSSSSQGRGTVGSQPTVSRSSSNYDRSSSTYERSSSTATRSSGYSAGGGGGAGRSGGAAGGGGYSGGGASRSGGASGGGRR